MRSSSRLKFVLSLSIALALAAVGRAETLSPGPLYGATGPECPSVLYRIDPSTGAATLVGPIVSANSTPYCLVSAIAFDKTTGGLFAIGIKAGNASTNGSLILVDTHTAAATEIGETGTFATDMSFRSDGALYTHGGNEADAVPHSVFTVDKTTGAATFLGTTGVLGPGNGIAFSPGDLLYHADGNKLDTLNQSTGAASPAATLTFPGGCAAPPNGARINAMDFQPSTGTLFGALNCGNVSWRLATINTSTGAVTNIGTSVDTLDALAFQPDSFSPAQLWVGLKNSDDVGLRLDLKAEVFVNGTNTPVVATGEALNVKSGSSGFNNAQLNTLLLPLASGATLPNPTSRLVVRVSVRRTCSGGGHTSGTVRFWYDGDDVDTGNSRDAGSRFDLTKNGVNTIFYLRNNFALQTSPGSSRKFIDKSVNSSAACPTRPYTEIGTWTLDTGGCRPNVPGC